MNTTDQNIQRLLQQHSDTHKTASEVEKNIMNTINAPKDYSKALIKSNLNIKKGAIISVVLLIIYTIITYTELVGSSNHDHSNLSAFFPAIFTGIIITVIYFEMLIGYPLFKKNKSLKS